MNLPWKIFYYLTGLVPNIKFFLQSTTVKNKRQIIAVAHRGSSSSAPENTLASFRKALEENADMIELDLHLSKDNALIVIHDPNTRRTTGVKGEIEKLDLQEIKRLDAGAWFSPEFKNEKIPTLDEALELVNGKAKLLVELKWPKHGVYPDFVSVVLKTIEKHDATNWVIIQSFEKSYLKDLLKSGKNVECHQLLYGYSKVLPLFYDRTLRFGWFRHLEGIKSITLSYIYLNHYFIKRMHRRNIKVFTFTLNTKEQIAKAINFGVDGVISDNHKMIKEVMDSAHGKY